jgi:hypothetical protein
MSQSHKKRNTKVTKKELLWQSVNMPSTKLSNLHTLSKSMLVLTLWECFKETEVCFFPEHWGLPLRRICSSHKHKQARPVSHIATCLPPFWLSGTFCQSQRFPVVLSDHCSTETDIANVIKWPFSSYQMKGLCHLSFLQCFPEPGFWRFHSHGVF